MMDNTALACAWQCAEPDTAPRCHKPTKALRGATCDVRRIPTAGKAHAIYSAERVLAVLGVLGHSLTRAHG